MWQMPILLISILHKVVLIFAYVYIGFFNLKTRSIYAMKSFKQSPIGEKIGNLFEDRRVIDSMKTLSNHGDPAVQEIGRLLVEQVDLGEDRITDDVKRKIGKWVREIMEENGYLFIKHGVSVKPGNLFRTGAIYRAR